jgi:hypothetical protein
MAEIERGQVWEMYSQGGRRWERVIVTEIRYDEVRLHYEGVIEFVTVARSEMEDPTRRAYGRPFSFPPKRRRGRPRTSR